MKLFLSRLAVFPVLQGHEEKGVVAGPHQAKQAEADNTGGVPDARAVGQDILHLPRNFVGALQGCRNRELEIDVEVALILIGQKARRHSATEESRRYAEDHQHYQRHGAFLDESSRPPDISLSGATEDPVEPIEKLSEQAVAFGFRLEQERRQRRTQRKSVERRKDHGNCDRHGELLVEPSGYARNKSRWHEHRGQYQRDADYRTRDLFHGFQCRCLGSKTLFNMKFHGLHHNDCIIHHQANRQDQTEKRQRVDGKTEEREENESAD